MANYAYPSFKNYNNRLLYHSFGLYFCSLKRIGMIDTVIFDMDGLLVDTEPLWVVAMQEVLKTVGVTITPELAMQTTGLRTKEVVNYWYDYFQWKGKQK